MQTNVIRHCPASPDARMRGNLHATAQCFSDNQQGKLKLTVRAIPTRENLGPGRPSQRATPDYCISCSTHFPSSANSTMPLRWCSFSGCSSVAERDCGNCMICSERRCSKHLSSEFHSCPSEVSTAILFMCQADFDGTGKQPHRIFCSL
jgi:hypothetical protein